MATLKYWLRKLDRKQRYHFFVRPSDFIGFHTIAQGTYEAAEIEGLRTVIRAFERVGTSRRIALDIGANIGAYCVSLASEFDAIWAYEPNPMIFQVLSANLMLNSVSNVGIYNIGVGSENIQGKLFLPDNNNFGTASLVRRSLDDIGIDVTIVNGDEAVAKLKKPGDVIEFVKIDTEGFELEVLNGLRRTLRVDAPLVAFEVSSNQDGVKLFAALGECGYDHFYWIERRRRLRAKSVFGKSLDLLRFGADIHMIPVTRFEDRVYFVVLAIHAVRFNGTHETLLQRIATSGHEP